MRILVGATFIISGAAKMIDPFGFFYKISEYLNIWQMNLPEGIIIMGAVGISITEFMVGFMLATGSYRRSSPVIGTMIMAVMLPLSIYLAIANPIEHCGCFGDFMVISNTATLAKNIVLTAALIWLIPYNRHVKGPFHWFVQWIQAAVAFVYIGALGLIGYHEQPLIDFRPYKIGTYLYADSAEDDSDEDILFVYEKNGQKQTFSIDNLPDDDSWTFVERIEPDNTSSIQQANTFTITDSEGETVTDQVISNSGEQLIVLIPKLSNADISLSYAVNELNSHIKKRGGSLIAVGSGNENDRAEWIDLSMADYPVYFGEDTAIKTVARGKVAVVYLQDGIIKWKRTLSSINLDKLAASADSPYPLATLATDGTRWFTVITGCFMALELITCLLGLLLHAIHRRRHRTINPKQ